MPARNGEGADGPVKPFDSSESCSPAGERFGSATSHALHQARDRLDQSVDLLERALDLLELLEMQIELDDVRRQADELRRDVRRLIGRRRP